MVGNIVFFVAKISSHADASSESVGVGEVGPEFGDRLDWTVLTILDRILQDV
jgi:hypothetical protein